MLDALLSFTKAVCKSCLRIRDRYTPATGQTLGPAWATQSKQRIAKRQLTSKKYANTTSYIGVLQLFLPKGKRYEISPPHAAIVTSCHSSAEFASARHMIFLSSNNSTATSLHFLQIVAIVHMVIALPRRKAHKNYIIVQMYQPGAAFVRKNSSPLS
jgi:hypothetical protein